MTIYLQPFLSVMIKGLIDGDRSLGTAGYVLSAHAHNLTQYAGKDRQLSTGAATLILYADSRCRRRCNVHVGYVRYEW
jgi:hypothetical protein